MSFLKKVMAVLTRFNGPEGAPESVESTLAKERAQQQQERARERLRQQMEEERKQREEVEIPTEGVIERPPAQPEKPQE